EQLRGDLVWDRLGLPYIPSIHSRAWLVLCLTELGVFDEGVVLGDEALRLAESVAHPPSMISAWWALGRLWRMRGELARALPLLTRGVELSKMWHIRLWTAGLGEALGLAQLGAGQVSEALATLTQAVEIHESMRGTAALSVRVMTL